MSSAAPDAGARTASSRWARLAAVLTVSVLLAAPLVLGGATPIAAACGSTYCGEVVVKNATTGKGNGRVVSDPPGIDCTVTGGVEAGACGHTFGWEGATSTYIDLSMGAASDSYVCYQNTCTGLGGSIGTSIVLDANGIYDVASFFGLGNVLHYVVSPDPSSGSGRFTTTTGGIDCRIAAGVASGTCQHDYWFLGDATAVAYTATPDAGSFGCTGGSFCNQIGASFSGSVTTHAGTYGQRVGFWIPIPVKVTVSGTGQVVSQPAGISCPASCSRWWAPGQPIRLTATPAAGWVIDDWGGVCNLVPPTSSQCDLTNNFAGAKVSVVFRNTATPPPSPEATARPRSTAFPRPSAPPSSSAPGTSPASTDGADRATPVPGGTADTSPGDSSGPPTGAASSGDVALGGPATSGPGNSDSDQPAVMNVDHSAFTLVVAISLALVVLALLAGVALGRRATRPRG